MNSSRAKSLIAPIAAFVVLTAFSPKAQAQTLEVSYARYLNSTITAKPILHESILGLGKKKPATPIGLPLNSGLTLETKKSGPALALPLNSELKLDTAKTQLPLPLNPNPDLIKR